LNHDDIVGSVDAQVRRVIDQIGGRMLGEYLKAVELGYAGCLDERTVSPSATARRYCADFPSRSEILTSGITDSCVYLRG
jgi:hypothetical protein